MSILYTAGGRRDEAQFFFKVRIPKLKPTFVRHILNRMCILCTVGGHRGEAQKF